MLGFVARSVHCRVVMYSSICTSSRADFRTGANNFPNKKRRSAPTSSKLVQSTPPPVNISKARPWNFPEAIEIFRSSPEVGPSFRTSSLGHFAITDRAFASLGAGQVPPDLSVPWNQFSCRTGGRPWHRSRAGGWGAIHFQGGPSLQSAT